MAKRGGFGAFSGLVASQVIQGTTVDWAGDDAHDREIDLGADYDVVLVFENRNVSGGWHLSMAYALGDLYGLFYNPGVDTNHMSGTDGAARWQGKMTGADANKILLGSDGTSNQGTNKSGVNYRALGLKLP